MTSIGDAQLSRRLSALRVAPPENGFQERLLDSLRQVEAVTPERRAKVLRLALRHKRPAALLALGVLGLASVAAAALDERVWQALLAISQSSGSRGVESSEAPAERARSRSAHTQRPVPSAGVEQPGVQQGPEPQRSNQAAPVALPLTPEAASATTRPNRRDESWRTAAQPAAQRGTPVLSSGRKERDSSHVQSQSPPYVEASSAERSRAGVPRLDLTDLPRGRADRQDTSSVERPSERLRESRDDSGGSVRSRERAAEARERGTDRRNAERPRRPIDTPLLDAERDRKASEARENREREDRDHESRSGHGKPGREH